MKRIVTPSLIERLNVNLCVSTIRLRLRHGGQPGWRRVTLSDGFFFLFFFRAMDGGSGEQNGGEVCECAGGRNQCMDQWKSLYGAYRLARSRCDGWLVAGNGPLQPPPEQTEMMTCSLVNNLSRLHLVQRPPAEPEGRLMRTTHTTVTKMNSCFGVTHKFEMKFETLHFGICYKFCDVKMYVFQFQYKFCL